MAFVSVSGNPSILSVALPGRIKQSLSRCGETSALEEGLDTGQLARNCCLDSYHLAFRPWIMNIQPSINSLGSRCCSQMRQDVFTQTFTQDAYHQARAAVDQRLHAGFDLDLRSCSRRRPDLETQGYRIA
jgi:hypothetical protein